MNIAEKLSHIKIAGHPISDAEQAVMAQDAARVAVKASRRVAMKTRRPVARPALAMDAAIKTLRAVPNHDLAGIAAAIRVTTLAMDSAGEYVHTGEYSPTGNGAANARSQQPTTEPVSIGVNADPQNGVGVNKGRDGHPARTSNASARVQLGFAGPAGGAAQTVTVREQGDAEGRQAMDAAIRVKLYAIKRQ
ncbi:hypothetical protein ACLKMY_32900 [Paraburkholderia mimosarum]|uniref:hypothetical protein n=1 Tax=Paraburkholderia mimosarum TaxID=312026 RepID=UPI0039C27EC0